MESPYDNPSLATKFYNDTLREGGGKIPMLIPIIDADGDPAVLTTQYKLPAFDSQADFDEVPWGLMMKLLIRMAAESHRSAEAMGAHPQDPR